MDRGTQSRLVRFILPGVLTLAVVAGGSLYLARGMFSASPAAARTTVNSPSAAAGCDPSAGDCAASPDDIAVAVAPAVVTVPPHQVAVGADFGPLVIAPDHARDRPGRRRAVDIRGCLRPGGRADGDSGRHGRRAGTRADQPGPLRGRSRPADGHLGPAGQFVRAQPEDGRRLRTLAPVPG